MKNIILDTNYIYDYIGRKKLNLGEDAPKRTDKIMELTGNKSKCVYISDFSVIEVLNRLSDNYNSLLEFEKIILQSNMKIVNIINHNITKEVLSTILNTNCFLIHRFIENLRNQRINVEVDTMLVMCEALITYYVELKLLLLEYEIDKKYPEDLQLWKTLKLDIYKELAGEKLYDSVQSWRFSLKNRASTSYKQGGITTVMKNTFNEITYKFISEFNKIIISSLKHFDIKFENLNMNHEVNPNFVNESVSKLSKFEETAYNSNYRGQINKRFFEVFRKSEVLNSYQAMYLFYLIEGWLFGSSKFQKNDIFDMLIIGLLDIPESVILTNDKNMRKFLKAIDHRSCSLG